ncbi:MAG: Na/Pi symporter [Planctomycetes bacterium]|nr:Na/Pi symporter [Planctomycetota bacterium]
MYFFLSAINVMGAGLKTLGKHSDWLERILSMGSNPFAALLGSVLVTSIVQSSSFTTSLIITLVASGQMPVETAIYAIMGANIGTSVTNIIVALGSVRIREQFRRAFTAALVHDIFNWLTVAIIFPLEWISSAVRNDVGYLTLFSTKLTAMLGLQPVPKPNSPIKVITRPVVNVVDWLGERMLHILDWCGALLSKLQFLGIDKFGHWIRDGIQTNPNAWTGSIVAVFGLLLLFAALILMVKNLKGALLRKIEGLFTRVFFRNDLMAYIVGTITTILVQSSSVTTSLIVPLAGAGIVKLKRVYAYTLGANLGTTVTGVIAATANPVAGAVTVAIAHVTFNIVGTIIWYPLKMAPIGIATWYGRLASESKRYAFGFLFLAFFVVPALGWLLTQLFLGRSGGP